MNTGEAELREVKRVRKIGRTAVERLSLALSPFAFISPLSLRTHSSRAASTPVEQKILLFQIGKKSFEGI